MLEQDQINQSIASGVMQALSLAAKQFLTPDQMLLLEEFKPIIEARIVAIITPRKAPSLPREDGKFVLLRNELSHHPEGVTMAATKSVALFCSRKVATEMASAYNQAVINACYPHAPHAVYDIFDDTDDGDNDGALDLGDSLEKAKDALYVSHDLSADHATEIGLHIETAMQQIDVAIEKLMTKPSDAN